MLKLLDLGVRGERSTTEVASRELRLEFLIENVFPRSTEVVAVCRDCGLWKGLELVSDVVGVAEEIDQLRRLLVRRGTTSESSSVFNLRKLEVRLFVRW